MPYGSTRVQPEVSPTRAGRLPGAIAGP